MDKKILVLEDTVEKIEEIISEIEVLVEEADGNILKESEHKKKEQMKKYFKKWNV